MTHPYASHDSYMCVPPLIYMCATTHAYVWHDLGSHCCRALWGVEYWALNLRLWIRCPACRDSSICYYSICVTLLIHMLCMIWRTLHGCCTIWDVQHLALNFRLLIRCSVYVWSTHILYTICVTWLIHVWHDSLMCDISYGRQYTVLALFGRCSSGLWTSGCRSSPCVSWLIHILYTIYVSWCIQIWYIIYVSWHIRIIYIIHVPYSFKC